ncbi:hypothetical protein [Micromonospora sp. RP3T]|uniref:hypothetical protein n=1 Tax=Micromonospora sp. RP3T TaxID=2135446 RepID=UPI003D751918
MSILRMVWRWRLEAVALAGGVAASVIVHRYVVAFPVPVAVTGAVAGALLVGAWRLGRGGLSRWRRTRWGWSWAWGWRSGEWWIGARRNFPMDALEVNFLGLTVLVGRG